MLKLSVNVNKVAMLRNSRHGLIPSPVQAGQVALEAGAHGLTVHPRPDQRHIRPDDVHAIADLLREPRWADREFNIEGNPDGEQWMALVEQTRPAQATFVPDSPEQFTSDHGWTILPNLELLRRCVDRCQAAGARVSLFMDPDIRQIEEVPKTGADRIELYTESYAVAFVQGDAAFQAVHQQFADAARAAADLGLEVNAGHDLNLHNLPRFATIDPVVEVSIGHALIADALMLGLAATVKAYLQAIAQGVSQRTHG